MQLPQPLSGVARVRGHAIASDAARAAARPIAHQRHAAAQHEDDEGVQPKAVASHQGKPRWAISRTPEPYTSHNEKLLRSFAPRPD